MALAMKARVEIYDTPQKVARVVAQRIVQTIKRKNEMGQDAVLVLPTGSTPINVYKELVRMHQAGDVSFKRVKTFNLDEYYPMKPDSIHSYRRFMEENLFGMIDIPQENINIPDGTLDRDQYDDHCAQYEQKIKDAGGADLALLGIGRSGHIGFNEPGSTEATRTRMVLLDQKTRKDAASAFYGEENVPYRAITMGVGTILDTREIILMATGENKAKIVHQTLEGVFSHPSDCPASYLKDHANCTFVIDEPAAQCLAQVNQPWRFDPNFTWCVDNKDGFEMVKRAVIHVATETGKGICELSPADFHDQHLTSLLVSVGEANVDALCLRVMNDLLHRIAEMQEEHSRLIPHDSSENTLVFSPHPDDDVICMGGLMAKLVKRSVPTKAVYMTNGSVAVADANLRDHMRFATLSAGEDTLFAGRYKQADVFKLLGTKGKDTPDPPIIQELKGNVRKAEAISAVEVLGLREEDTVFLDLPFYRTGLIKKNDIGEEDVKIVLDLLVKEKPAHIFVAGDMTDPHGTHRMCYYAIRDAVKRYRSMDCYKPMKIWLYRGAWQEWSVHETSVFVPLTKVEMERKINSIFKHQSQKDRALFPGNDTREFWQRARDRNRNNAIVLKKLGLPAFHAIEAFVIVDEMAG